jgi:hypothetical protein
MNNRFSLKPFWPMMNKYTQACAQNDNYVKPSNDSISFILMYSKAIEVKKGKKHKLIICKN